MPPSFLHDPEAHATTMEAAVLGPSGEFDIEVCYGVAADSTTGDVWFWAERP